ncbi:bifunctional precorrin-2 dehydrogenase/sirohydrochlorin ferrochelatase [Nitrosarchaeum sp. AC2]|uniref:precorrin-2 dehydrogenase/sirohydrochlorin ferrochelatase family protein n=1 Tax=Nitrosarchaeum sp. AC2 TaxID=2259673 RepID=UPI0015CE8FE6|nr:bifunctional precorrin-2 dehydrogenase/sirohydrochlorin ferrochelatase [Nitrosarchaeum sp. AC2]QLH10545.1 bifunctional precorrin-2 dehydrogenase/sirohydrochlorin ferrochelatase [Nitrosarchaeum sp. AC2]
MIVNLNLQGKVVIVIGGGNEALKRIKSLLKEKCQIIVISSTINDQIKNLIKNKKIKFKKQKIQDTSILSIYKPDIVITTTNNKKLNQKIINDAKSKKITAYSSDNSELSDFSNPAIIDFDNLIQIAIFTGGKSPAMAKKLRMESEKIFKKLITKEEIGQIKIQNIIREIAKNKIATQNERKNYLNNIMNNKEIKQLIKEGQLKKAENQARTILRNWK